MTTKSKYYQARIKGTDKWVRLLRYYPGKEAYDVRWGTGERFYFEDELADFCI